MAGIAPTFLNVKTQGPDRIRRKVETRASFLDPLHKVLSFLASVCLVRSHFDLNETDVYKMYEQGRVWTV